MITIKIEKYFLKVRIYGSILILLDVVLYNFYRFSSYMNQINTFNSSIVRQHNDLIEAKFTSYMTEREQKIFAYIISETTASDLKLFCENKNKEIALSVSDFAYILKTNKSCLSRDAAQLATTFTKKSLLIKYVGDDGDNAFEEIVIIPYMKYESGVLTLLVNSKILKYLLDVKEQFTSFKLEHVLRLGSSYAIKIYQLLKQYEKIGEREFELQELKEILGIADIVCYERYAQFKRDVIELSKKHINAETDINIDYLEIKISRKVSKLKFFIRTKMTQYQQAIIGFEDFIKRQDDRSVMKIIWLAGQKDKYELMKKFKKSFLMWIDVNCQDYHSDEIKVLQYESPGSLLYNESGNAKIVKSFYEDIKVKK